ncbi:hypothetical protein LXL04_025167 [Taraxacum kok-saghyz]
MKKYMWQYTWLWKTLTIKSQFTHQQFNCETMGYPRDAPATVLFGEWFRFGKPGDQYPHNVALTTFFCNLENLFSSLCFECVICLCQTDSVTEGNVLAVREGKGLVRKFGIILLGSEKIRNKRMKEFEIFRVKKVICEVDLLRRLGVAKDEPAAFYVLVAFGCSAPDSIGSLTGLEGYALIQDVCRKVFVDSLLEVGLEVFDIYAPA